MAEPTAEPTIEILSSMGEAALLRDSSGAVLWVNDSFCALFGGKPDAWRGRDFGAPRVREGGERRRYEGETTTRRGRRWIEWEETALPGGRVLSIGRDITARREGEEALRGACDEALAARRAGKAFMAAVTHELRTPLNGVLGMAGLLETSELTPDQTEHVAAIRESGEHLLAMIGDVLDAARLEAGALELERGEVDCARLVRSVVELLAPRAFEKGLEIAATLDPALPECVTGDEGRLRQILFNLTGAALHRTETGGVTVAARLTAAPGENLARIELSVADNGPGFPEEARVAMANPSLLHEADSGNAYNAGMGLLVARRLVAAMGGDLEVEEPAGGGARITARITFETARSGAAGEAELAGRTLVVASPSAVLRDSLCAQANTMGAEAVSAETPGAALQAMLGNPGAVLLVDADWRSRVKNAAQAASATGVLLRPDQRDLIPRLKSLNIDFYLMKPVRASSLAARMKGVEPDDEAARAMRGGGEARPVKGARILLAEDNRVNALLASTMMRGEGCIVDIVANGADAVAAVRRTAYDLVFMDMRMPIKNGLDAARDIRALGGAFRDLPIVALTANAFAEDREACLAAGMDDFATKPIDMDGVAALLRKWTRREKQAKLA